MWLFSEYVAKDIFFPPRNYRYILLFTDQPLSTEIWTQFTQLKSFTATVSVMLYALHTHAGYISAYRLRIYTYVRAPIHTYIRMCIYPSICVWLCVCVYIRTYVNTYVYFYISTHVCTYISYVRYIYTYVRTYNNNA